MSPTRKQMLIVCVVLAVACGLLARRDSGTDGDLAMASPTAVAKEDSGTRQLTMAELLDLARRARQHMSDNLDDYTARFIKQETDTQGVLGVETETFLKVQTRLRGDTEQAPMRVYMLFQAPEAVKGREVIWGEDLNDGKLAVHEVGLLLSLKTIWLDPNGLIAMRGERYPISEIGMVKLVEKLIERGEQDLDNDEITISLTEGHTLGDVTDAQLAQVRRLRSSGGPDDFSLAEIVFDPGRQLVLRYRAFGWPEQQGGEPPLLESYTYLDVKTNVGLTDSDFDPANPQYNYPAF